MADLSAWTLCDQLTVSQAALLVLGENPSCWENLEEYYYKGEEPSGYKATRAAIINAVSAYKIKANIVNKVIDSYDFGGEHEIIYTDDPDWEKTTVHVESLKNWLVSRGQRPEFFFSKVKNDLGYLDPSHKNYSNKLAAAVASWQAITANPDLLTRKTVKQALESWLKENAAAYGLLKDDGSHNQAGIEQISTVVNWDKKGGAPRQ